MVIIYDTNEQRKGSFSGSLISQWSSAAVMGAWRVHIENRAFLFFMYSKGTYAERVQASKELDICDRKIAFWEKHTEFNKDEAARIIARVKSNWSAK